MPFFRKYAELFGRNPKSVSELPHTENQKQHNGAFSQSVSSRPYIKGGFPIPQYIGVRTDPKHYMLYSL